MRLLIRTMSFTVLMAYAATASSDGFFDGKSALLCSVYQLFECDPPNACQAVTPEQIAGFSHMNIDFKNKLITRAGAESPKKSTIERIETKLEGKLILQGIEDGEPGMRDGAGWSISIMNPEGTMVMSTSADGFAIVGLGACVPKP
jgi:hypothetical protein